MLLKRLGWLLLALYAFPAPGATPCLQPDKTCSEKLTLEDGWIRVYRTHPLTESASDVEQALVMVHGAQRNGDAYYATALAAAAVRGKLLQTLIVAPEFRGNEGPGCRDPHEESELFFGCQAWNAGYPALNSTAKVNSFDAMDRIVQLLSDRNRFPNLKSIVLAGHSGGGQFMQRYAAMNLQEHKVKVPIRYVVANPSSYVYPTEVRLREGSSCTADGNCTGPFGPYWDRGNCTGYNRYRYGLDNLGGYASTVGAKAIRKQFATRNVTYLIGDLDVLPDSDLDKSCAAQAQGLNRRERGVIFWNYMKAQFDAGHTLTIVPRCGHNAACMFNASAGARTLFP